MKKSVLSIIYLSLLAASASTNAAAPIVDGKDIRAIQAQETNQQNQLIAELVMQINQLQQEVRELRGQVEEQDYRLKQMSKQQKQLYLDIDRRLQSGSVVSEAQSDDEQLDGLSGEVDENGVVNDTATQTQDNSAADSTVNSASQERANNVNGLQQLSDAQSDYNQAFSQLKDKNFVAAKDAFVAFVERYPSEPLTSNAHYWLGQLYYNDKQYEQAEQQFKLVYVNFPQANKMDAAMLKIGQIHEKRGNKEAAKATYQKIAEMFPNSTAGKLAKAKLGTL
ncbi:MAG: tol-pal system protein YbgF [Kangiellaceae bacterium]|nr:tol-pal system protein YbgF [Kangiellaceae bacterium]